MKDELLLAMQEYWDECKRQPRTHAGFFNAPRKYKFTKELNIACHLFVYLEKRDGISFDQLSEGGDPPDVKAVGSDGNTIGIEVVELVNQEAITAQIQNSLDYYDHIFCWDDEVIVKEIQFLIDKKEPKDIGGFDKYIVLIHSDEPRLDSDYVNNLSSKHNWIVPAGIDEGYLLFSYDPVTNSYPVVQLF